MLIATFNVNSIKARLKFVLHWLAARQPDLVCVQELKLPDAQFPYAALEEAGYGALVHGQPRWNGVAVLYKRASFGDDVEVLQTGLPGAEDNGSRLITVRAKDLWATSVYVPNGKTIEHDDFAMKLSWLEKLRSYLKDNVDMNAAGFVGGDFNVVPAAIDSHAADKFAGQIFHTEQEQGLIRGFQEDGFIDLYRALEPTGNMFSWWDYRGGSFHKNKGLRIDFLLATAPLRERVSKAWVDRDYRKKKDGETPSDHAPVFAEFV